MTTVSYEHGTIPAISAATLSMLVDLDQDDERIDRLLQVAEGTGSADDVLDILIEGGVRVMPDFVVIQMLTTGARLLLRGAFEASVDDGDPLSHSEGPWRDIDVTAGVVRLSRRGKTGAGRVRPLRGGVVLADALILRDGAAREPKTTLERPTEGRRALGGASSLASATDSVTPVEAPAVAEPVASADRAPLETPTLEERTDASDEAPHATPAVQEAESPSIVQVEEQMGPESPTTQHSIATSAAAPEAPDLAATLPESDVQEASDFDFLFGATTTRQAVIAAAQLKAEQAAVDAQAAIEGPIQPLAASQSTSADANLTRPSPLTVDRDDLLAQADPGTPAATPMTASPAAPAMITFPWATGSGAASSTADAPQPPLPPVVPTPQLTAPVWTPVQQAGQTPPPHLEEAAVERTVSRAHLMGQGPVVPNVLAARCPQNHLSQAFADVCRVCGQHIPTQSPFEVPRPRLGLLRLSTGAIVHLDRGAILGRNPRIPPDYVGEQPNLVRVVDPEKGVSSQHLEITLDYWNVMVRDLGSTNGSEIILPGSMPMTLRAGSAMILEPGSRVIMGGQVSFVFEVTA